MSAHIVTRIFLSQETVLLAASLQRQPVYTQMCVGVCRPICQCLCFFPDRYFSHGDTLFVATALLIIWKSPTSSTLIIHLLMAQFCSLAFTNSAAVISPSFIFAHMCQCVCGIHFQKWNSGSKRCVHCQHTDIAKFPPPDTSHILPHFPIDNVWGVSCPPHSCAIQECCQTSWYLSMRKVKNVCHCDCICISQFHKILSYINSAVPHGLFKTGHF